MSIDPTNARQKKEWSQIESAHILRADSADKDPAPQWKRLGEEGSHCFCRLSRCRVCWTVKADQLRSAISASSRRGGVSPTLIPDKKTNGTTLKKKKQIESEKRVCSLVSCNCQLARGCQSFSLVITLLSFLFSVQVRGRPRERERDRDKQGFYFAFPAPPLNFPVLRAAINPTLAPAGRRLEMVVACPMC